MMANVQDIQQITRVRSRLHTTGSDSNSTIAKISTNTTCMGGRCLLRQVIHDSDGVMADALHKWQGIRLAGNDPLDIRTSIRHIQLGIT